MEMIGQTPFPPNMGIYRCHLVTVATGCSGGTQASKGPWRKDSSACVIAWATLYLTVH